MPFSNQSTKWFPSTTNTDCIHRGNTASDKYTYALEVQQGATQTKMSLEDLNSDFQSDESDYEPKKEDDDNEKKTEDIDEEEELNYFELVLLHNVLMCFQHIYDNNALIDMEVGQPNI